MLSIVKNWISRFWLESLSGACVCVWISLKNLPKFRKKKWEKIHNFICHWEIFFNQKYCMKKNDQILLNFPSNIFSQKFYENESKVEFFCIYGFMIWYNYMNLKNINSQVCYSIFLMFLFMLFNMLQYMLFVLN